MYLFVYFLLVSKDLKLKFTPLNTLRVIRSRHDVKAFLPLLRYYEESEHVDESGFLVRG